MDYTQNMNLSSPTGYAMPFNDPKENPRILLDYGTQKHPKTGEDFHHSGIDFAAKNIDLYAVGSGVVTGTNTDTKRGFVLTIKYDDYEVTYSPIILSTVQFGNKVKGGQKVAVSGNFLHIGVKFKDEEINPKDFLQMIYGNMLVHQAEENPGTAPVGYNEGKIVTGYDKDHDEIEGLFGNFMGSYFKDMATGKYKIPESTTESIKDLFGQAKQENLFFQSMPSMMNPLGFGASAYGLIGQMMNLLIGDFLQYLAMQHRVFLSSWSDEQKKKLFGTQ